MLSVSGKIADAVMALGTTRSGTMGKKKLPLLLDSVSDGFPTSNLANASSLLWHAYAALPEPSSSVNWAGFYIRSDLFPSRASSQSSTTASVPPSERKLLLGPFQGKTACQEIRFGKGVCGTAALKKETVVVPDVLEFPGHIACDAESRSEIVVPILHEGEVCFFFSSSARILRR